MHYIRFCENSYDKVQYYFPLMNQAEQIQVVSTLLDIGVRKNIVAGHPYLFGMRLEQFNFAGTPTEEIYTLMNRIGVALGAAKEMAKRIEQLKSQAARPTLEFELKTAHASVEAIKLAASMSPIDREHPLLRRTFAEMGAFSKLDQTQRAFAFSLVNRALNGISDAGIKETSAFDYDSFRKAIKYSAAYLDSDSITRLFIILSKGTGKWGQICQWCDLHTFLFAAVWLGDPERDAVYVNMTAPEPNTIIRDIYNLFEIGAFDPFPTTTNKTSFLMSRDPDWLFTRVPVIVKDGEVLPLCYANPKDNREIFPFPDAIDAADDDYLLHNDRDAWVRKKTYNIAQEALKNLANDLSKTFRF